MAKVKSKKRQAKRKAKLNKRRNKLAVTIQKERADYFFREALWYWDQMDHEKALTLLMKALRHDPENPDMLEAMVDLGFELNRQDLLRKCLLRLYNNRQIEDERLFLLCDLLARNQQYELALEVAEQLLVMLPEIKIRNKRKIRSDTEKIQQYCRGQLEILQKPTLPRAATILKPPLEKTGESAKPPSKSEPLKKPACT
jgi:tetratricopeptide (TPR) repeat protein